MEEKTGIYEVSDDMYTTEEYLDEMHEAFWVHFIEIPKLQDLDDDANVDTVDMLTACVEFLKDPESNVVKRLEFSKEEIKEAKDEFYRLSRDKNELELYNLREKSFEDKGVHSEVEPEVSQRKSTGKRDANYILISLQCITYTKLEGIKLFLWHTTNSCTVIGISILKKKKKYLFRSFIKINSVKYKIPSR